MPVSIIIVLFRKSKLRVNHVTLLRGVVEDHLDEDLDDGVYTLTEGRGPGADPPSLPTDQPPQYHSVVESVFVRCLDTRGTSIGCLRLQGPSEDNTKL